jgi:hypothetical protein
MKLLKCARNKLKPFRKGSMATKMSLIPSAPSVCFCNDHLSAFWTSWLQQTVAVGQSKSSAKYATPEGSSALSVW